MEKLSYKAIIKEVFLCGKILNLNKEQNNKQMKVWQIILCLVFGLAGVDTPYQKMRIEEVVSRLGFSNFKVVEDELTNVTPFVSSII